MFENEIRAIVHELTENRNRSVSSMEFVAALIDRWGVHGEQDPRYQLATWEKIKDEVQSIVRGMKRKQEIPESQRSLFDYKHLQSLYVVEVDGDSHVIPLDLMTREQLEAKAAEHRSQGRGHYIHADEIERFIIEQFGTGEAHSQYSGDLEEQMVEDAR